MQCWKSDWNRIGIPVKNFSGIFVKNPSVLAFTRCLSYYKSNVIIGTYSILQSWSPDCSEEKAVIDTVLLRMKRDG